MNYLEFISGILIVLIFGFIFVRNIRRTGWVNGIARFETVIGLVAGVYLIINAIT